MKIKSLIKIFETALEKYEKAYQQDKLSLGQLSDIGLGLGICLASGEFYKLCKVFFTYYKNFLTNGCYLYKTPYDISVKKRLMYDTKTKQYHPCLKQRIDFLKTEVKDLKSLLKKGYTDV